MRALVQDSYTSALSNHLLGLTALLPIARFSGVVSDSDYDGFFRQFDCDDIVGETFENQSFCTSVAGFFGEG